MKKGTCLAAAVLLLGLCGVTYGQTLTRQTAQMSTRRARPAVAFVGEKMLLIDGYDDYYSGRATNTVDVYDVHTWQRTGTMTSPTLRGSPAAVTVGSKVVVLDSNVADIYDDSTGLWSTHQLPQGQMWMGAASLGGKAFFGGGGYQGLTTVNIYDGASGVWSTASLSVGRTSLAAAAAGTQVLFGGGYSDDRYRYRSDVVDIFDMATGQWTVAHLSQARSHLTATSLGTRVFFAGGSYVDGNDTTGSDVVDIFDTRTQQWSVTHMPHARTVLASAAVGNKVLFAGGGYSSGLNYVDVYDTSTGLWSSDTLSVPAGWLGGGGDGLAAVFAGGKDSYTLSNSVDIFTPEPATLSLLAAGGLAVLKRRRK